MFFLGKRCHESVICSTLPVIGYHTALWLNVANQRQSRVGLFHVRETLLCKRQIAALQIIESK